MAEGHLHLFHATIMLMKKRRKRIDPNTVVLLKRILSGIASIFLVVLLLFGIWHGTRVSSLTITSVKAEGGETIDNNKLEALVTGVLEGEYVGFVPKRFSWFYPKKKIYETLYSIDRIHNVEVERVDGTSLSVTYDEYIPHALWCVSVVSDDCFFVDDSGFAFAEAPKLTGASLLRFVKSGYDPTLDEILLETDSYKKINYLIDLLSNQGWFVSYVEIDQVGDVFLQIVGGGELKVSLSITPEETIDNLFVVLNSDKFSHIEPGNFKYIDLRFGNKVFVNEEFEDFEMDTTSSTTENEIE